ncbi:ATP-binding protein [Elizabethkingia meningoseptica]|uniref:ATP-binding protein n=1 Tax=Elizabethkingia meningoseptica TaxID=238 RepID=UPI0021A591E5|nr:ATP-binding protein [Elizabethkingia meningoseptica]MCT4003722.1 AAA family ATPase [Elizabethkingia anophelis]MCT4017814.1 AAA family ATPase [Elizabethkingia anophelis]MCT4021376.1 AAA family ATPase [Elizabethkingia anophelis]MDE5439545.1 ATP-binding protein [Elizabethkingia meningoseptica]MDE5510214.1 ATP-binding protein [Elizabethkingia meningoseptica]
MIIGLLFRHYKCYKGTKFFPFQIQSLKNLSVFIGNNGAGKSSILEALDTYFNNREWTIHYDVKKNEAFVSPVFIYSKEKAEKIFSKQSIEYLEIISSSIWNIPISANSSYRKYYENFFQLRDKLSNLKESHYIFFFTKEYGESFLTFTPFDKYIKEALIKKFEKFNNRQINILRDELLKHLSYLYIPVEASISDFLRLEAQGMQELMNKDIKQDISDALSRKRVSRNKTGIRVKKLSILDLINENLEAFIKDVETTIQELDEEYNFSREYKAKNKLTANHISNVIIEAYFSKRRLKKSQKSIVNLSAGERKRALIDIAYTFLSHRGENNKQIILAIDEPESSLHISQCYEQFNKVNTISSELNTQVLLTTHWYGSLPILNNGILHHITNDGNNNFLNTFSLDNYFEERGNHPEDVLLKSFYDLSSSILSSIRLNDTNWLLVEGNEDKKYLEYYLSDLGLKILPLGGCTIVTTIYEYLFLPLSQKNESKSTKGKIYCLIDTDSNGIKINVNSDNKFKNLSIRRLNFNLTEEKICLNRIENENKYPTCIEEALDPLQFYVALSYVIESSMNYDIIEIFKNFEFDNNIKSSFVKGDYSILNHMGNGRNIRDDKNAISDFINKNKTLIADEYISYKQDATPAWINEVKEYFKFDTEVEN